MSLRKGLWPSKPSAVSDTSKLMRDDTVTNAAIHATAHRPPPSRRRASKALKLCGIGIGGVAAVAAAVLLITWNADYWLLRDRLEHMSQALFGTYVPPLCRKDPSQCVRNEKTGRLIPKSPQTSWIDRSAAACKGPEGLELHCQLHDLFDYFNKELFDGRLPRAVITLQRKAGTGGYYAHRRFRRAEGGRIDEIALNPSLFGKRSLVWLASVLVHEMGHMERAYFGKSSPIGDHDEEWGEMMKRVGLHPSSTGQPGGSTTGPRMSHYTIKGGAFERAVLQHPIFKNDRLAFYE